MSTTRDTLEAELARRLGDVSHTVWSAAENGGFLNYAVSSLYPTWFQRQVAVTTAGEGPLQPSPEGARNLYLVGIQRPGSARVRPLRGWAEGDGEAFISKTGIEGQTLVWCWTSGWQLPSNGTEILHIPVESEEVVLLRAHISALEKLLSDRVSVEKYHALQVRQGVTEDDIAITLDALHVSLREHLDKGMTLPEVQR